MSRSRLCHGRVVLGSWLCYGLGQRVGGTYSYQKEHVHTMDAAADAGSVKWTQEQTETSWDCIWAKLRASLIRTVLNQMLLVTFCYSHSVIHIWLVTYSK